MKRVYGYQLPLQDGTFRKGLILQLHESFGEIAPLPGHSRETLDEATEETLRLLPSFPNVIPTLPSVRFGLFCTQQSLDKTLRIPLNALEKYRPGFQALKLKLGNLSLSNALTLVKQAPKNIELRLDFNRKWPLDQLLAFASHFQPTDFAYLEEPTAKFSDLLFFSKATSFPIAVDESIPFVPYWDIPTLKALVIKPSLLGYIPTPPPNVELIFSSLYESGVGTLHLANLSATYNPHRPHGLDPYTLFTEDLLQPKPLIRDGFFHWTTLKVKLEHPSLCLIASAP